MTVQHGWFWGPVCVFLIRIVIFTSDIVQSAYECCLNYFVFLKRAKDKTLTVPRVLSINILNKAGMFLKPSSVNCYTVNWIWAFITLLLQWMLGQWWVSDLQPDSKAAQWESHKQCKIVEALLRYCRLIDKLYSDGWLLCKKSWKLRHNLYKLLNTLHVVW